MRIIGVSFETLIVNLDTVVIYINIMLKTIIGWRTSLLQPLPALAHQQLAASTMLASWYGPGFHGRYNLQLTVRGTICTDLPPHIKLLPFGTKLRVCYNSCVDVRINDRGPFIGASELDLSKGAAQAIGLTSPGVANVTVTYLIINFTICLSPHDIFKVSNRRMYVSHYSKRTYQRLAR